ncbi:hypothetical protein ACP4OV_013244 [Aristida adscensionis]
MVSLLPRAPCLGLASAPLPKPAAAAAAAAAACSSSLRPLPPPAMSSSAAAAPAPAGEARPRKLPVLLFDVMDTIVLDPFYHHIPAFFQMSMKELLESKHPTAWSEFEMGLINENELAKKFFNDGRSFDLEGEKVKVEAPLEGANHSLMTAVINHIQLCLKECMVRAYEYIDGVEDILCCLKQQNYEMHAFTNYPVWYQLIEDKLKLSKYLSWTFCSCLTGKRKPSPDFYLQAVDHLNVDPASCIFIDDRMANIEAALSVGMVGLHFKNADVLRKDLCSLGVELSPIVHGGEPQVQ